MAAEARAKHAHLPQVVAALEQAFAEGRIQRERFIEGLPALFEPELLTGLNESELRNLELFVNYEATRREREALVHSIAEFGLEVRGDSAWLEVHARVGGEVGYYDDLASFYRGTAINVNNTSLQMPHTVNQRVFDCPAAGGFLITDAQSDIADLFEEDEVVTYRTLDELRELVQRYLVDAGARKAIVLRAQARIRAQHTHVHRLRALEGFLRERFAG